MVGENMVLSTDYKYQYKQIQYKEKMYILHLWAFFCDKAGNQHDQTEFPLYIFLDASSYFKSFIHTYR